jgi:hypothetical protein
MHDPSTATLPRAGSRGRPESSELDGPAPKSRVFDWADQHADGAPRSRTPFGPFRRHPIRSAVVLALVVFLTISGWSYGYALSASGSDSLAARSVEWVRDHGGSSIVNWIEREWYQHHQPPKGGTPKPGLIPAAAPPSSAAPARKGAPVAPHLPPPDPVVPLAVPPLPGEGIWHPAGSPVAGLPAVYTTAVRPDPVHTSLVTGVAWMDTKLLKATLYAGSQLPGGTWQNMSPIPPLVRPTLIAGFNSAFRLQDSRGGYYAEGRMAKPLVDGDASLVIHTDGTATVAEWGRDAILGPDVATVRQNLWLLVDGGNILPQPQALGRTPWGGAPDDKLLVWRSGIGVTATGALLYVGGNGLTVSSLARVLAHAGAVRAMEMDIHPPFVDYFSYNRPPGVPAEAPVGTKLVPDMASTPARYFVTNSKDFVALFAR